MTGMFRVFLVSAFLSLSVPAVATAQQVSLDSIVRRIEVLERKNSDLERRVHELESPTKIEPSRDKPAPASAEARDVQNWRRLRRGMTMEEVRSLLGEPERVDVFGGGTTIWRWDSLGGAAMSFDGNTGRLESWSEPRR